MTESRRARMPPGRESPERSAVARVVSAIFFASAAAFVSASAGPGAESPAKAAAPVSEEDERLRVLRRDIETLRRGIGTLSVEEKGLLGDLKALEADLLGKEEELARIEEELSTTEQEAAQSESRAKMLVLSVEGMKSGVARRLRALYRLGPPRYLRVLLASSRPEDLLSAFRTAASLSTRDAEIIGRFRQAGSRARAEALRLERLRTALASEHEERSRAHAAALAALERKRALLASIRTDRQTHQTALGEMEAAERSFGKTVSGLSAVSPIDVPRIAFENFHGLLDWPAEGPVSARFGTVKNPRFGTTLAHSGLDIDALFGAPIRSVQDGVVVFSQWFRGYGLTVIIDHGGGWLSVYSHASALIVEKGEAVRRGQKIAVVGDSGSLRGPYVYFELRKDGRPVDPSGWLRAR